MVKKVDNPLLDIVRLIGKEQGRLQVAIDALLKDDYACAIQECQAILKINPVLAAAQLVLAIIYIKEGNYHKAITACQDATAADPSLDKAFILLGYIYSELNQPAQALTPLQQALDIDPTNSVAQYLLGETLLEQNKLQEAANAFQQVLITNPQNTLVQYKLVNIFLLQNRCADAIQAVEAALQVFPSFNYRITLGKLYFQLQRYPEALAEFQEAILINSRVPEVHYLTGESYLKLGRPRSALIEFRTTLCINPKRVDARCGLGKVHLLLKKYDEAIADFQAALSLNSYSIEAYTGLGSTYLALEDFERALSEYHKALKIADVEHSHGDRLAAQGKYWEAIDAYRTELALDPLSAIFHSTASSDYQEPAIEQERRQHARYRLMFPVKLESETGKIFEGSLVDVSQGGLLIECSEVIELGAIMRLGLKFDAMNANAQEVYTRGRVVRQDIREQMIGGFEEEYRYGIEFLFADTEDDQTWWDLLDL